jgi:putative oxidoreductase
VGGIIAVHGTDKLFGWFGGHEITATASFLESLGLRPGRAHAWLLGSTELAGAMSLAASLLTLLAATAAVTGVMVVAIVAVHWSNEFFAQNGGFEFPFALGSCAAAVAVGGPGRDSIDRLLDWSVGGTEWGVAAIVIDPCAHHRHGRPRRDRPASPAASDRSPSCTAATGDGSSWGRPPAARRDLTQPNKFSLRREWHPALVR